MKAGRTRSIGCWHPTRSSMAFTVRTDGRSKGRSSMVMPRGARPLAFKPFFQMMQRALGDLQVRVERTIVEGDMCAAHCCVTARHVGPTFGAPATDKPVQFWGMCFARVHNGQIVEGWNCFDFLSMYQQLGWVKNPPLP